VDDGPTAQIPATPYDDGAPAPGTGRPKRRPVTADPVPARWGNLEAPRATPTIPPATDYLLVRPPQAVVQQDWGTSFEQSIVNPDESFHHGPIFCPAVDLDRPDGLAPIGVFGDHTLEAGGQVLVSYRYNTTNFDGNRDGTSNVGIGSVLA